MATSNDSDDEAILDISTKPHTDRESLVKESSQAINSASSTTTPTVDTVLIPSITRYRPTNILRVVLFLEFLTIFFMWLAGSSTHLLIDDITHYRFTSSIFDLVSVSICKFVSLIILLTELETFVIARLYRPDARPIMHFIRYFYTTLLFIVALCSLAFGIVKLVLVIYHHELSQLYLASVYVFLVFSAIESVGMVLMVPHLKRLKLLQKDRSEATKKKVDLARLLSLAKSERYLIIIGLFFLVLSSATQIIQPYYFGKIVDQAQKNEPMHLITNSILILLGINCAGALTSLLRSWLFELSGQRVVYRLRQKIFDAIIKQEIAFFDETRTGELTNRLASDTQVLQSALTVNISMAFRFILQILGSLGVMFYLNVTLALVLMAVVPVIVLITRQYSSIVQKLRKKYQDELAGAGTTAEESISNVRTVRIFGAESKMSNHYHENLLKSYEIGKKLALNSGIFMGLIGLLTAGGISTVLWYGAKLVHDTKLSVGLFGSFLMYMLQVAIAFAFLASVFSDFMQAVGASTRIFELLDRKEKIPVVAAPEASIRPENFDGSIHLEKVCFSYPTRSDQQVLHDITFSIKTGQTVALVGPSGGGKSTVASLIERFYDPTSGTIYFNSHPLTSIDPLWLRQNVAFVNQEPTLFACSIRDNITFGLHRDNVSLEEIQAAAREANAHEFIEKFENKYDTLVGERGVRLSGGQRQRVAIARALLMSPQLLLLDEATSALDAESEHLVQEAIERVMVGRTVLVIAHRLSTVRNADLVIVINQGRIVEQGTHDSLLAKDDGVYKKLVLRQLMAGQNTTTID